MPQRIASTRIAILVPCTCKVLDLCTCAATLGLHFAASSKAVSRKILKPFREQWWTYLGSIKKGAVLFKPLHSLHSSHICSVSLEELRLRA